ncbi:MAG TPA: L,D-transpeptidase, partial [Kofleriaceae bacterium]|nr:L,D-transpeptidase [Kofleriaceae bacterium]
FSLGAALAACGGGKHRPRVHLDAGPPPITLEPAPRPRPPEIPAGTTSLRLVRSVAVRLSADDDSKRIGTIAQDTRVAWRDARPGPGCHKSWYALEPQGWVCGDFLEPTTRPPTTFEMPRLDRGETVPGTYGKVVEEGAILYVRGRAPASTKKDPGKGASAGSAGSAGSGGKGAKVGKGAKEKDDGKLARGEKPGKPGKGASGDKARDDQGSKDDQDSAGPVTTPESGAGAGDLAAAAAAAGLVRGRPLLGSVNVRKYGELTSKGKVFWKVSRNAEEYIPEQHVREHHPSLFQGTRLNDDTGMTVPIAFVWPRSGTLAWTRGAARGGGLRRQLQQRTAVPILESAQEGTTIFAYRIGEDEWIDASNVRVASPVPLPAGLKPGERWIDVDLDKQILVAYEGDLPVYATLVSTGLKDTPTETGVYRVWKKVAETDMKGLSGEDPYSVATVPWTQFFSPEKGLALHTAYWHDRFGVQKSHGCVNLAPRDARWLYFFTDPQVPPGWSMAAGVVEAPGSIVRVRSKADPDPPVKGYAQKVDTSDDDQP